MTWHEWLLEILALILIPLIALWDYEDEDD